MFERRAGNQMTEERKPSGLSRRTGVARLGRWWRERAPRGEFWALVAATLFFNVGMSAFLFLYNLFLLDLGFREQSLGIIAGAMALGSMAGTIPMGVLARRFGLKRILLTCLLLIAGTFAARACLPWYSAQVVLSFLSGVALCGWAVVLFPAVANVVVEDKLPFAFSILFASAIASCSLGGLAGAGIPAWCQRLSVHYAGAVVSAVEAKRITLLLACAVTALAVWPVSRLGSEMPMQRVRSSYRFSPFLVRFLIASACWGAALGFFNPFVSVFFARYLGVPLVRMGVIFSVAQLAQAGAVLVTPLLLRRAGLVAGITLAQLTTAATLGLLAMSHGAMQAAVIFCCYRAAMHMSEPGMQSLLMDRVAVEDRSNASAMNFLVTSIAQAIAAAIAGFAFARFRYPFVLAGIAATTAVAAILFSVLCSAPDQSGWRISFSRRRDQISGQDAIKTMPLA
jgi:MFS family permease